MLLMHIMLGSSAYQLFVFWVGVDMSVLLLYGVLLRRILPSDNVSCCIFPPMMGNEHTLISPCVVCIVTDWSIYQLPYLPSAL
jgi:hypothetical protein